MSQGFKPRRFQPGRAEQSRWAAFSNQDVASIPTCHEIQILLVEALLHRIKAMDRTRDKRFSNVPRLQSADSDAHGLIIENLLGRIETLDRTRNKELAKRIRLYIRAISVQDQTPGEVVHNWFRLKMGHWEDLFHDELMAIARGKLVSFTCLPAVLRLHRDHLYSYMSRPIQFVNGQVLGDGYASGCAPRRDSPRTWFERNHRRLYEELSFWHCSCVYRPDFGAIVPQLFKGPGELIPALLSALHTGNSQSSIQQIIKRTSRPGKIPPFLT